MKHWRYKLFLSVCALGIWPLAQTMTPMHALLAAFDIGALVFALSCIGLWANGTASRIRAEAERDDAGSLLLLFLTGLIGAAILASLVPLVSQKHSLSPPLIALTVATLGLSWLFTNLIFTFHYARLFYGRVEESDFGGLDFPGNGDPEFSDFINFAFVIGMTCQTADIAITHAKMRRIATWHGIYAFVFNLGILALTVNVVAGG